MGPQFRFSSMALLAALFNPMCSEPPVGGAGGAGGAGGGSCATDADCRTFSDYCTGCDCRALPVDAPDPVCPGPGVQCFVDPCMGGGAVCKGGRCEVAR